MKKNVVIANKDFEYVVVEDGKTVFTAKNIEKLKKFLEKAYQKPVFEFKFDNSILEKVEK